VPSKCSNADPDEDIIGAEGIMKLCEDLEIEPADIAMVSDHLFQQSMP